MNNYYIVTYQCATNDKIMRRIICANRYTLIRWFDGQMNTLLSFTKISKKEAKHLGYKFE